METIRHVKAVDEVLPVRVQFVTQELLRGTEVVHLALQEAVLREEVGRQELPLLLVPE